MAESDHYPDSPGFKAEGTSQEAARLIAPRAGTLRDQVLEEIRDSVFGLTADECAAELRKSVLSIRPRLSELRKMGLIRDTGARRSNESGVMAAVWNLK